MNSGDFGAFLRCGTFLTFFPAFTEVFFPLHVPDAFLGFCSSSLDLFVSTNSGDFGAFLGCLIGVFSAFVAGFFSLLNFGDFLGFCSSSPESSVSIKLGDFGAFYVVGSF